MNPKKIVQISIGASGVVALAAVLDLALGIVYGRQAMMDIMFILAAAIVIYLGLGVLRELT